MEVVRVKKILARNLLIYIGLHCVRRSSWTVTTLATLVQNLTRQFPASPYCILRERIWQGGNNSIHMKNSCACGLCLWSQLGHILFERYILWHRNHQNICICDFFLWNFVYFLSFAWSKSRIEIFFIEKFRWSQPFLILEGASKCISQIH